MCAIIILSGALGFAVLFGGKLPISTAAAAPTGSSFNYVITIIMENKNLGSIFGNSCCPYESGLANQYSLASSYSDVGSPSLPNYIALTSGSTQGITDDSGPSSHPLGVTNIVDRFEASGVTWKAYMESMPSNCYSSDSSSQGTYYVRHNPFVYYTDISGNSARCAKVVPAGGSCPNGASGSQIQTCESTLLSDLNATSGWANFMWLTPNGCNDMHDCSASTGDNYLSSLIPKILSSTLFSNPANRAVLFLFWDEYSPTPGAVWAGPVAKPAYKSSTSYNHYSALKTIESNWGLPTIASADGAASPMTEFFTAGVGSSLQASFTLTPSSPQASQTVTFTGSAIGGTTPYTYNWSLGDGSTASGASTSHSYGQAGQYSIVLTVKDSANHNASSMQTLTVVAPIALTSSFTYSPSLPSVGTGTIFVASASGGTIPYQYNWNFGDSSTATGPTAIHAYSAIGVYNSTLTVTDSASHTASSSQKVTVTVAAQLGGLHVNGSSIVNQNGAAVTLVGLNYGDYPNDVPPDQFNTGNLTLDALHIKAAGFNTVNLVEEWGNLENSASASSFTYNSASLNLLQSRINALTAQGLYVIVKIHSDAYTTSQAQNLSNFLGSEYCGSSGRFSDTFYSQSASAYPSSGWAHLTRLWLTISNVTRNNPMVIGYDLLNEPIACSATTSNASQEHGWWYSRVTEITQAVRANGDNRIVFVEEAPFNAYYVLFKAYPDPNTVASVHWYRDVYKTSGGSWAACSGDYQTLYNYYSNVGGPSGTSCSTVPLSILQAQLAYPNQAFMIGEFGDIYNNSPGDTSDQWILNSILLFKSQKLAGWLYWSQGDGGTWVTDLASSLASKPDFGISASPVSISAVQGTSGTSVITITSFSSFTGTVTLSASSSTSSLTAGISPSSIVLTAGGQSQSTLTISTSSSTPIGSYTITVRGVGGALSRSLSVSFTVTSPPTSPDFAMSANQATLRITVGSSAVTVLTLTSLSAFSGAVNLASSISSSSVSASFGSSTIILSAGGVGTTSLTISTSPSASPGAYSASVTATSGSLSHSVTIIISVQALAINGPPLLVVPGAETSPVGALLTFNINASNPGVSGAISLSATNLPPGASFTSSSGNPATGKFSWNPSSSVKPGVYTVTFKAVQSGSTYVASKDVAIDVVAGPSGPCSLCPSPFIWPMITLAMIGATVGLLATAGFIVFARSHGTRPKGLPSLNTQKVTMPTRVSVVPLYGKMRNPYGKSRPMPSKVGRRNSRRVLESKSQVRSNELQNRPRRKAQTN